MDARVIMGSDFRGRVLVDVWNRGVVLGQLHGTRIVDRTGAC